MICTLCYNSESMNRERQGTKRKQDLQAEYMLLKSARRYKEAVVGDSVMIHLPEVDSGRCEFPNIYMVILEVEEGCLYRLQTQTGELKGY